MNALEVIQICRLVKALCPSQTFDEYTPDAWAIVLEPYSYTDAKTAIATIAGAPLEPGKSRYIEPGHIIDGIQRIRRKRLEDSMPEPPSGLDPDAYLAWLRTTKAAVANGTYQPQPLTQIARPELVAEIRNIATKLTLGTTDTRETDQ